MIFLTGNVGIGTTNPQLMLDIAGSIRVGSTALAAVSAVAESVIYAGGVTQYGMELRPVTAGATTAISFTNSAGIAQGGIAISGSGATTYNTTSDYRLKENITHLVGALVRLRNLEPKRFNYRADQEHQNIDGFLAHEVQSVIPEAVQGHKDQVDSSGKPIYQQLDLSKIVPLITAAARELDQGVQGIYKRLVGIDAQVQSQARAIASVNTKTAKLEAENAQLKVKNSAKDKEIAKLKKDNAEVKARIDRIEKILLKK